MSDQLAGIGGPGLLHRVGLAAQFLPDEGQELMRRQRRLQHIDDGRARGIKAAQRVTQHRGLADADLAGDDDETLAHPQPVFEHADGFAMRFGQKDQRSIGRDVERIGAETVEVGVQDQSRR
jgi:hypothetical protein